MEEQKNEDQKNTDQTQSDQNNNNQTASEQTTTDQTTTGPTDTGSYKSPERWSRLIPMIILVVCFAVAETVLYIVTVIQFIWNVLNGSPNDKLSSFGANLSTWLKQNSAYLTFASEEKPFPWAEWPKE